MKWLAKSTAIYTADGKLLAHSKSVDDARALVLAHNTDIKEKPEGVVNKGRVEGITYTVKS